MYLAMLRADYSSALYALFILPIMIYNIYYFHFFAFDRTLNIFYMQFYWFPFVQSLILGFIIVVSITRTSILFISSPLRYLDLRLCSKFLPYLSFSLPIIAFKSYWRIYILKKENEFTVTQKKSNTSSSYISHMWFYFILLLIAILLMFILLYFTFINTNNFMFNYINYLYQQYIISLEKVLFFSNFQKLSYFMIVGFCLLPILLLQLYSLSSIAKIVLSNTYNKKFDPSNNIIFY